ncbi:uncharacterized protein LOC121242332 [Juglans microcarpa x Juglans regia]|uniref:uncharacterized protein LOC121242332 n=1 Tax=Juglans microcarpa x Juglans regia TaxID=2249226 RepID=UPI001B7E7FC5|nr:uncharacterized protein LOC121242332 [Juglans microcarpa x Juglans regia]
MTLHGFSSKVVSREFPLTLKGGARAWFGSLLPGTIIDFTKLARFFLTQVMASRKRRRPATYLLTVKQRDDESLKLYLSRFNRERMMIDDQDEKITLAALLGGIRPYNPFMIEIARRTPYPLREFMDRADGFINAEDMLRALIAPRRTEQEKANKKAVGQSSEASWESNKKKVHETKRKEKQPTRGRGGPHIHSNLAVETEKDPTL